MNILLVEDCDAKASQVVVTLQGAFNGLEIRRSRSFRSAVHELESSSFDLVVLDLLLPIRDGETPTSRGGRQVLDEILDGSGCRPPSHIVCLTGFREAADEFRDEAQRRLVHLLLYDETSQAWRDALTAKIRFIKGRLRDATLRPQEYNTDVAIVTSSPKVELDEVLKLSDFTGEYHQADVLHYFIADWRSAEGKNLSIVACAAPSMGMTAACATACKVIERWRPRILAMTGIAAGTNKEQEYGDVLVAESAFDYGSGKVSVTDDGERRFTPSPNPLRIDPGLQAVLQKWERDQMCMDIVHKAWYAEHRRVPRLIIGVLATGAAVVQDASLVHEILRTSRKVVGIEMEAYGIFHAAHLATAPPPRVLIAKSISDFADKRKNDDWQQYAAFTSARFIFEFLKNASELKLGKA
jgi:nucleoside phosphorylase